VGDTDTTDQLVTDEEIAWALDENSNVYFAAAIIAESISAKFARHADKDIGDLAIKYSQRSTAYAAIAARLRIRAAATGISAVYAGGISVNDKATNEDDTDRVKPTFRRGIHDQPGAPDVTDPWNDD